MTALSYTLPIIIVIAALAVQMIIQLERIADALEDKGESE